MQVIGVTRTLNEAPIVEAFVRHHASLLDLHVILDDGSTDDTVAILHRLHAEGLRLQVYETSSVQFVEPIYLTGLYRIALAAGADWVVFLDCDELLDTRGLPGGLRGWLGDRADVCLGAPVRDYLGATAASAMTANVFERLVLRCDAAGDSKILLRRLDTAAIRVGPGAHSVDIDGVLHRGEAQTAVRLAHYPRRSQAQFALKVAIGRLKVLAGGSASAAGHLNAHYVEPFAQLQRAPREWLTALLEVEGLVEDGGVYRGGALRYAQEPDDEARLMSLVLHYAEQLARSHGRLLDAMPEQRQAMLQQSARVRRVV